jgi:hypothetical protein
MRMKMAVGVVAGAVLLVAGAAHAADKVCPALHMPVCGLVKPEGSKTFDNACLADKAKAPILHEGACVGDGEKRCPGVPPACGKSLTTGKEKTYKSLCWAEKDWAVLVHPGVCASTP